MKPKKAPICCKVFMELKSINYPLNRIGKQLHFQCNKCGKIVELEESDLENY